MFGKRGMVVSAKNNYGAVGHIEMKVWINSIILPFQTNLLNNYYFFNDHSDLQSQGFYLQSIQGVGERKPHL